MQEAFIVAAHDQQIPKEDPKYWLNIPDLNKKIKSINKVVSMVPVGEGNTLVIIEGPGKTEGPIAEVL